MDLYQFVKWRGLIRQCSPARPQLREVRISVDSLLDGQDFVSAVVQHASALEELSIDMDEVCPNVCFYLQLLVYGLRMVLELVRM